MPGGTPNRGVFGAGAARQPKVVSRAAGLGHRGEKACDFRGKRGLRQTGRRKRFAAKRLQRLRVVDAAGKAGRIRSAGSIARAPRSACIDEIAAPAIG